MSADPALEGRVLAGRFRVARRLGEGGMGAVYEAEDIATRGTVALKVLAAELGEDPKYVERFRREAEATARLAHPHIVRVHDFLSVPGEPVLIVMELLLGEPLSARLSRGPLSVRRAVEIALALASALGTAHAAGVVHRDLKPANVFLVPAQDGGEHPKLLDFGIAKLRESEGYERLTRTGVLIGTPRYASPEQVSGRRDVDHRSDVFSLGVLLYAMLAGRPPFVHGGAELLIEIRDREPPDPRLFQPAIPAGLVAVVAAAMRKDRDARTPSMEALAAALAPFASLADEAPTVTAAPPIDPQASAQRTVAARPAPRRGLVAGTAAEAPTAAAAAEPPRDPTHAATVASPTLPHGVATAARTLGAAPTLGAPPTLQSPSRPAALPGTRGVPSPARGVLPAAPAPSAMRLPMLAGGLVLVFGLTSALALGAVWLRRGAGSASPSPFLGGDRGYVPTPGAVAMGPECIAWEQAACSCLAVYPSTRVSCDFARATLAQAAVGTPGERDLIRGECAVRRRYEQACSTQAP